jgi:hypothetical protein
MSMNRIGFWC